MRATSPSGGSARSRGTLRRRLLVSSLLQLAMLAAVFGYAFVEIRQRVIPDLEEHLRFKTLITTTAIASQIDVALAANDERMIERVVRDALRDRDFAYLELRDPTGRVVFRRGEPGLDPFAGTPRAVHAADDRFAAWANVTFEGIALGRVAVGFETERVHHVRAWLRATAGLAFVVWLIAFAYAYVFAQRFAQPIRAMQEFSRRVAAGSLDERLPVTGCDELRQLAEHMNEMTEDLQTRERERLVQQAASEQLQRELVAVSRVAGMAEIATGVLHDIGNVLTSLNVSVSQVGDRLRDSRIGALPRLLELADAQGGLAALLGSEKGRMVPQFLQALSGELATENADLRRELELVTQKVDHIKTIVMTQQAYATSSGLVEELDLEHVVDDALSMTGPSLARHGIQLVREYEPGPALVSDRHKLLQILINLLSNARHALKAVPETAPHPEPRLTVRIRRRTGGVAIEVEDTGVGIAPENLELIFVHGFTTKPNGHGFGLHASANAARELGGSLRAASPGPGRGATFTLELPLVPRKRSACPPSHATGS